MQLLNSASVRVPAGLVCRRAGLRRRDITIRYGLIRRSMGRYCLVDTGYGPAVTNGKRSAALRIYNKLLRPRLIESGSPGTVLGSLGASRDDVEAVILTHFHADHVARLNEFPRARIVALGAAAADVHAMSFSRAIHNGIFKELLPPDFMDRLAPLEARSIIAAHPCLGGGYDIFGDGSYLAVDLPGHALGHFGLYWLENDRPTLYATDAAWTMTALLEDRTPAIARNVVFHDPAAGQRTEARLRGFVRSGGSLQLCHDWEAVP